jgi:signal transduction histidine kinase/CheY-like chemotaxis protein
MNSTSNNNKYSIRAKLTLIIVAISMVTLLIAASLFTLTQLKELQYSLAENLTAVAKITGGNAQAAIAFDDKDDANKILSELNNDPRIIAAGIYNKENKLFSNYSREKENIPAFEPPEKDGYFFKARQLHLLHSIYVPGENELIGKVYIQASLNSLYEQLLQNISITGFIVLLSLLLCVILASRLQKLISVPILQLSEATDKVKDEEDFSVRVNRDDFLEIEHLCEGFNSMLEHIQSNERELLESRDLLEQRVADRTQELEIANIELKKSKEIAESANKAKSQFLASMSHELRTPLNAILGFTELILSRPKLEPTFESYINIINESGDHLLALINDILDLAKIEAGKLEIQKSDIDLFSLLESTVAMLEVRAQNKGINLIVEYAPELPSFIHIDGLKLRQILINLIGNAIKFTEKGEIKLSVSFQEKNEDKGTGKLNLSVIDTGPGIKQEELKFLFAPFAQTESGRKQHGTGLGLNLSKNYIELMGGEITVDSKPGKGTRFDFYLMTSVSEHKETKPIPRKHVQLISKKKNYRVLIAEDIEFNIKILTKLIKKISLDIEVAHNGLEAIDSFSESHPDIILMDIQMPVMDGIEAMEKIRNLPGGKEVKIIALTAGGLNDDIENKNRYKFDDVMYKPYKERDIYNMLQHHLSIELSYEQIRENAHHTKISIDDLNEAFPGKSLNALLQVAVEGDIDKLREIINTIEPEYVSTADELNQLVDEYKFDVIISMFTPLARNAGK